MILFFLYKNMYMYERQGEEEVVKHKKKFFKNARKIDRQIDAHERQMDRNIGGNRLIVIKSGECRWADETTPVKRIEDRQIDRQIDRYMNTEIQTHRSIDRKRAD